MTPKAELCLSCFKKDKIFNIFDVHECDGVEEIYFEMLQKCFDISISPMSNACGMCEACIWQLRDAHYFKQKLFKNIKILESLHDKMDFFDSKELNNTEINQTTDLNPEDLYVVVVNDCTEKEIFPEETIEVKTVEKTYKNKHRDGAKSSNLICKTTSVQKANDFKAIVVLDKMPHNPKTMEPSQIQLEQKQSLKQEQEDKTVAESSNFTCEYCGKNFTTKIAIKTHMSCHQTGQFPCHVCGKVFSKLNSRNCHTWRVHRARAAYRCGSCGACFRTLHARLRHLRIEHNLTPDLPCPYCANLYYDSSSRSKHIRSTHLKVRNHKCGQCKMSFFKRRLLLSHMATVHGVGDKNHVCHVCEKRFYNKSTLNTHLKRHERYTCNICNELFSYDSFKTHIKLHEGGQCDGSEEQTLDQTMGQYLDQSVQYSEQSVVIDEELDGSNDTVYFDVSDYE